MKKNNKKKVDRGGGRSGVGSVGVLWQKTGIFGMRLQFISADFPPPVEQDDAPNGGLNKP